MKKTICIILVLLMSISFFACGSSGPEGTVKTFCAGLKEFDADKIQGCLVNGTSATLFSTDGNEMMTALLDLFKKWSSSMTYDIVSSDINGDKASVTVDFTYTDASPVIKAALSDYITRVFALAFSGGDTSGEAIMQLFLECVDSAAGTVETAKASATVVFNLVKDGSKWKIESVPAEVANIASSNVTGVLENFSSGLDSL